MEIKNKKKSGMAKVDSTAQTRMAATAPFRLPLRSLEPQLIHSTTRNTVPKLDRSPSASIIMEPSLLSPTGSNSSHEFFTESGSMTSTAASSPRSPTVQYEFSDHSLHPLPSRKGSIRAAIEYADVTLPAIHRASEEIALPGFGSVLRLAETSDVSTPTLFSQTTNRPQHSPSPEPSSNGEHVLCGNLDFSGSQDPITDCLNKSRRIQKIRKGEFFTPLTSPFARGLHIQIDVSQPCSRRTNYSNREGSYDAPSNYVTPPRDGGISKRRNKSHCNKRYTKEQNEYIRYHVVDLKYSWKEVQAKFDKRYPDPNFLREVQGLQGAMYRQNKFLPKLDVVTNSIVYLTNGHMEPEEMQVRRQVNRKDYGLVNLFTEEALTYSWVREEDRQKAAALIGQRRREREEAKRLAMENGLWEEVPSDTLCACCLYAKRPPS